MIDPAHCTIRLDLWSMIFNHSSGNEYVFNSEEVEVIDIVVSTVCELDWAAIEIEDK